MKARRALDGKELEWAGDWSALDADCNCVVVDNGDGTETRHYRPIKDAADLEARLRADGINARAVKSIPVDLKQLWIDVQRTRECRELIAQRAIIDKRLLELGMTLQQLGGQTLTMNFWRDGRGRLLSAEHEFVSVASHRFNADERDIAAVLQRPDEDLVKAWDRVRQYKTDLRRRNIAVDPPEFLLVADEKHDE